MLVINSAYPICIFPLIFLWVGQCWTAPVGQSQQQYYRNTKSFASFSPSAPPPSSSNPAVTFFPAAVGQVERQPKEESRLMHQSPSPSSFSSPNSSSRIPRNRHSERDLITTKIRLLPKDKLNQYRREAARQLQVSLIRSFQALSNKAHRLPRNIQVAAKRALAAAQAGNLNPAMERQLPSILLQGSQQQGQPAKQLQGVLSTILPQAPPGTRGALQEVLGFLSSNLSNVNTLLSNVLGTVPDLLTGVIKSLTNNLGAVTGALNGTVASLGSLLGSVLG